MFHIVLVEPEIPQNTGNVARTCAVTGAQLHLVRPLGFSVDDKQLKRAGLDYWRELNILYHDSFAEVEAAYPLARFFLLSTHAKRSYADAQYRDGDFLVFGKETADQAFARFTEAVGGVIKAHPGQTVAVVTHGTVMTLFASRAAGLDPFSLWKQLGIPSFIALSLPDLKLLGMVGQVAAAG